MTLDLDVLKLRNFQNLCQDEAAVDAHGCVAHILPTLGFVRSGGGHSGTYTRGPLHVARSTGMGNAKASERGASNGFGTTPFV